MLTTASAVGFIALLIALLFGLFNNPYAALVVFVALPALFVLGLLLIPFGMWLEHRRLVRHPDATREWFVIDFRSPATRRRALMVVALTAVNVVIVLVAGYGALHSMESPSFCGQTCHTPMHPQFTAWQDAPHSQVACVQCHIGEGGRAFVKYKMNGMRQLYHVVTGQIPRPIPGVADMRPAQEVCGACHWSGKGFGDVVRVKREYADDETNTETATILQMFLGGPGAPTRERPRHPLARRSTRANRIHLHGRRAPDHSVRQVHGCAGPGPRVRRSGHDAGAAREGHLAHDGLHRLPQRRGSSRRADTRAGRGCGARGGTNRPRAPVRPA